MQMTEQIREFIAENFLFGPADEIGDTDSFLESGILDSTGVLQLVDFLEETYGIKVEDEEFVPENLDSIEKISAYLTGKLGRNGDGEARRLQPTADGGRS